MKQTIQAQEKRPRKSNSPRGIERKLEFQQQLVLFYRPRKSNSPRGIESVGLHLLYFRTRSVQGNLIPQGELKVACQLACPKLHKDVQGNLIPQGELKA